MEGPINWKLVSHPMNWVVIALMWIIPLIALRIVLGPPPEESQQ